MPLMIINLNGDNVWPELADGRTILHHTDPIHLTSLPDGMASGKPSVALRFDLEDGSTLVAETSGEMFVAAARALMARYPELDHG